MSNAWFKVKVWTKLTLFFFVLVYMLVFIAKNSGQHVEFWYWYNGVWPTSLLYFTFFTFLAGVLVTVMARTIYKTVDQVRELRRRSDGERRDRELHELRTKAAMVHTWPVSDPIPVAPASTDPPATP